jgi:flagellar biosynthesis protein FlhF
MILVDTPGLQAGRTMEERLQSPGWRNMHDACFHLVLNPLFSARQYEAILHRYRCPQTASCVWCKLDEACAFGDMLNVGWRSGLPFSLFSSGSALKETLVPAEEKDFWQLVFKHTMPLSARKPVQV